MKGELLDALIEAIASRVAEEVTKRSTSNAGPTWLGRRDVPAGVWPSVRAAVKSGELKAAKVGRGLFVSRVEFDRWMHARADVHTADVGSAVVADDPIEAAIAAGKLRRIGGGK